MTDTQRRYYEFILQTVCDRGFQPSREEMAAHFGVYPRAVADVIGNLARQGCLSLPDFRQERCLGLPHIGFTAVGAVGAGAAPTALKVPDKVVALATAIIGHVEEYGFQPTILWLSEVIGNTRKTVAAHIREGEEVGLFVPLPGKQKERAVSIRGIRYEVFFRGD